MMTLRRRNLLIKKIGCWIIGLTVLNACVGRFETKPELIAHCNIDWQQQAGISSSALPDANQSAGLQVLVWNIHDRLLPGSIFSSKGHSENEIACIGDLASNYDLVLFQEAFVRPAQIARYTKHAWADHPLFTEGGGGDKWPLRAFCEICLSPGLLMLAQERPDLVYAEPYSAFAGKNTPLDKADEYFSKGFQLVRFPKLWVLNSHMDSGRGQASIKAHAAQVCQMTLALKWYVPPHDPLLIGMDSNFKPKKEKKDKEILEAFLEENNLTLALQSGPDLIATRNLRIENPQTFSLEGVLSDHDALSIVIHSPS